MAKKEDFLDLYLVDKKFIHYLSKVDDNVMSVSPQIGKDTRPFVGIVLIMGEKEYCIPLTSPKDKFNGKSKEDYIKIPDPKLKNNQGAPVTIGILNINNMIPVTNDVLKKIDLSSTSKIDKNPYLHSVADLALQLRVYVELITISKQFGILKSQIQQYIYLFQFIKRWI